MKTITVTGMSCDHCKRAVETALTALGLSGVTVNLEAGTASFKENAGVSIEDIRAAVEDEGFEVTRCL